jgi:hypothetical protein
MYKPGDIAHHYLDEWAARTLSYQDLGASTWIPRDVLRSILAIV